MAVVEEQISMTIQRHCFPILKRLEITTIYNGVRNCSIIIGSPVIKIDGISVLSDYLVIYVLEEDDSNVGHAKALGMQTKFRDRKF